jgi:hypothetical protein
VRKVKHSTIDALAQGYFLIEMWSLRARSTDNVYHDLVETRPLGKVRVTHCKYDEIVQAGEEYRKYLIAQAVSGELSYKGLSEHAWHHTQSGGCGVEDFAMPPTTSTSNAAKHVDLILSRYFEHPNMFYVDVWVQDPWTGLRCKIKLPMRLPHSTLDDEYLDRDFSGPDEVHPDLNFDAFLNHVGTRRARQQEIPYTRIKGISFYWDGINYTKTSRGLIWAICYMDISTGKRYLCALLRSELCCREQIV